MADIALLWSATNQGDIATTGSDIATDEGLQTAIFISLFTDRRVREDEEFPAGEVSRRGWWGDVDAAPGDQTGSRLWLLHREKQMPSVIARAEEYSREAVQWLIDDKVAEGVDVVIDGEVYQRLGIEITVRRARINPITFRYNYEWQSQTASTNN